MPDGKPRRAKEVVSLAPAAAKRRSLAQAWMIPMPAAPLMAQITGSGMRVSNVIVGFGGRSQQAVEVSILEVVG